MCNESKRTKLFCNNSEGVLFSLFIFAESMHVMDLDGKFMREIYLVTFQKIKKNTS